jgi:hypothetical protein
MRIKVILFLLLPLMVSCQRRAERNASAMKQEYPKGSFGFDQKFLTDRLPCVVLASVDGMAKVMVVPAWQGRVMTSTLAGSPGDSYGWINYDHIASGKIVPHMNAFGGEERFWLGPEGGQFSIYFKPGDPFDFDHWQTPPLIDTEPFILADSSHTKVTMVKKAHLTNYSGNVFDFDIQRQVSLLTKEEAEAVLGASLRGIEKMVAYSSTNKLTNTGANAWTKDSGMLSVWILGMYKPSTGVTITIPFRQGSAKELGPVVNDSYFGTVPGERLKIEDGVIFFSGDGKYRSKIGLNPRRSMGIAGSYDEESGVLTLVKYTQPEGVTDYVNSMWEIQDKPFSGDVVNSYNDGPLADGSQMGPFYEIESSSPAAALAPGESLTHIHTTLHLKGPVEVLDRICQQLLGVDITTIKAAFK